MRDLVPISLNGKIIFSVQEMRCKCGVCDGGWLAQGFDGDLMALRLNFGKPMVVNSACRCMAHNTAVGGAVGSFHVFDNPKHKTGGTCAVDISTAGKPQGYRDELVEKAWQYGWCIGLSTTFIHIDKRSRLLGVPQIIFTYPGYKGDVYPHLYKRVKK